MKTILIIGANRGIGLALTQLYLQMDYQVIATCRDLTKAVELKSLADSNANVNIESLDITDENQIQTLAGKINAPIDILLLNAGVGSERATIDNLKASEMQRVFNTNVVAQTMLVKHFHKLVSKSDEKKIISISSRMGSIADNDSGGVFAYRASKSALNAVMKSIAIDLKPEGIHVSILHPGWVKTDMGGDGATLTPEECAKRLHKLIDASHDHETGKFRSHDGTELAW